MTTTPVLPDLSVRGRELSDILAALEAAEDADTIDVLTGEVHAATWELQAHQHAPPGDWWTWCFQGGRGTGKTHTGTVWIDDHMNGPPCDSRWPGGHKGLLLGPTHGDIISSAVKGVSGLKAYNKDVEFVGRKDGSFVIWPNGAEAVCLGMHTENDAERLRAQSGNVCTWYIDEAAIGRHLTAAIDNLTFGARGSVRPHGIATTTPKPTPQYKAFLRKPGVVVTRASSLDNRYLPAAYRQIIAQYEGTRLGRQEILGELVDDYEGALWTREFIEQHRFREYDDQHNRLYPLDMSERLAHFGIVRVGVGIDPSTWIPEIGAPDEAEEYVGGAGIETGLVVVGMDRRRHLFVFDDLSARMAAVKWARRAVHAYHAWNAAWVVPETNAGGDMVLATIHLTDPTVTIYREPDSKRPGVRARVGKRARAEPVAAMWEQGKGHMVGEFPALEATLCFPAGTQVETVDGVAAIEDVSEGDLVATRAGFQRVVNAGPTGTADRLVVVSHDVGCFTCTERHPVWTDEYGYVPASSVAPGMTLRLSPNAAAARVAACPSCGEVDGGGSTTAAISGTSAPGLSIGPSTKPTLARSPRGIMSIIGTATRSTTGRRTSWRSRPALTLPSMSLAGSGGGAPPIGARLPVATGRSGRGVSSCARCAATSSHPEGSGLGTALAGASVQHRDGPRSRLASRIPAVSAATSSGRPDRPGSARIVAVSVMPVAAQPVYDLTVEGAHEFYAEGVLVHNCGWDPTEAWSPDRLDAMVWAATALQPWRRPRKSGGQSPSSQPIR